MAPSVTRILVVDDNEDAAIMACTLLDVLGYTTHSAFSALQALDAAAAFLPDVIFLDLSMPGMSGITAAPMLRALCAPGLHIVALSALGDQSIRKQTMHAGFNGHLLKPAPLTELVAAIAGWQATQGARHARDTLGDTASQAPSGMALQHDARQ